MVISARFVASSRVVVTKAETSKNGLVDFRHFVWTQLAALVL